MTTRGLVIPTPGKRNPRRVVAGVGVEPRVAKRNTPTRPPRRDGQKRGRGVRDLDRGAHDARAAQRAVLHVQHELVAKFVLFSGE